VTLVFPLSFTNLIKSDIDLSPLYVIKLLVLGSCNNTVGNPSTLNDSTYDLSLSALNLIILILDLLTLLENLSNVGINLWQCPHQSAWNNISVGLFKLYFIYIIYMNKKSIDKIDIFTLNFNYNNFFKDIFNIKNLDEFMNYVNNDIENDDTNIYTADRLLEYVWYVFIDEIIINKNKFINFYVNVINIRYNKKITNDKLEVIINENIKKYLIEKNNINYHKIILESI